MVAGVKEPLVLNSRVAKLGNPCFWRLLDVGDTLVDVEFTVSFGKTLLQLGNPGPISVSPGFIGPTDEQSNRYVFSPS